MDIQYEIIKLTVAYTLLCAFVFTVGITCLAMVNVVKISPKFRNCLFAVLILELGSAGSGFFSDLLRFSSGPIIQEIEQKEITARELGKSEAEEEAQVDIDGLRSSLFAKQAQADSLIHAMEAMQAQLADQRQRDVAEAAISRAIEEEAKAHVAWAVCVDAHRDTKYHSYVKAMSPYEAVLKAQSHSPAGQHAIATLGREKIEAYIAELEQKGGP